MMLLVGNFEQCEGKDASNYTYIASYTMDSDCKPGSGVGSGNDYLTACSPNGQKTVNSMKLLATSEYPAGGDSKIKNVNNQIILINAC